MVSTLLLHQELAALSVDLFRLGDCFAEAAEELEKSGSLTSVELIAKLLSSRKRLVAVCARFRELEKSLSLSPEHSVDEYPPPLPATAQIPSIPLKPLEEDTLELTPATAVAEALSLSQLPELVPEQGNSTTTDPFHNRVRELVKIALKAESADEASKNLGSLALLYYRQGKNAEAEMLHKQTLAFRERFFGPEDPQVATTLNNLAILYRDQGRYTEAEVLCRRSLKIAEKNWGTHHPKVARRLANLADLYLVQGKHVSAEPLYGRAMAITEQADGPEQAEVIVSLEKYIDFLQEMKRNAEAAKVAARVKTIQSKRSG